MLIVQLIAGIALGSVSALIMVLYSLGFGVVLLAYTLGGALGFAASGFYFRRKFDTDLTQKNNTSSASSDKN